MKLETPVIDTTVSLIQVLTGIELSLAGFKDMGVDASDYYLLGGEASD